MAAGGLSDHQIEEFREAFSLYDRNDDGTVTTKDLGLVLKAIGQNPSDEETNQLVSRFDSDGSGSIDFPEFLALIAKIQRDALDDQDEIKEAINVFDKDSKGFLTRGQVENIVNNTGEKVEEGEAKAILDSVEYDKNGCIDIDKLVKIIFNQQSWINKVNINLNQNAF